MDLQNQKPESIQEMFKKVQGQLQLTLQAFDRGVAAREIHAAERVMGKIESLILANPMVTDEDLRRIVDFTRGSLWNQAREHVSRLA